MSVMTGYPAERSQYNTDAVLSATPVRLVTMLYDRLLLDLGRAEVALNAANWSVAWENLRHADAILAELASSLKIDGWDGANNLLALYTYTSNTVVNANIHRDAALVRECIDLMEPMRQTWHEAAGMLPAASAPATSGLTTSGGADGRELGTA